MGYVGGAWLTYTGPSSQQDTAGGSEHIRNAQGVRDQRARTPLPTGR